MGFCFSEKTRASLDKIPLLCCCRTKPNPCRLASVHKRVGLLGSKKDNIGTAVSASFAAVNTFSWLSLHRKSFLVLSRGLSGVNNVATVLILEDNWLTSPKKEYKSVRLVGFGNCDIPSVMDSSTRYPSEDR